MSNGREPQPGPVEMPRQLENIKAQGMDNDLFCSAGEGEIEEAVVYESAVHMGARRKITM